MLTSHWGEPVSPLRQLIASKLRKPCRVGDHLLFVAEMDPDQDYMPALDLAFSKTTEGGVEGSRLSLLTPSAFAQRARYPLQALFAQYVVHWLRWTSRDRAFKATVLTVPAVAFSPRSLYTGLTFDDEPPRVYTTEAARPDRCSCVMVTDGTFSLFLINQRGAMVFPAVRIATGEDSAKAALRALETQFGPVCNLDGHPLFEQQIRRGLSSEPLISTASYAVHTCKLSCLRDLSLIHI